MRIGIDARTLSWNWTGPWRYLRNLLNHLAKIDRENEYFLFLQGNSADSMVGQSNFVGRSVRSFLNGNGLLAILNTRCSSTVIESYLKGLSLDPILSNLILPAFLRHDRIDVFHSPFNVLPLVKTCPAVVTIHDLAFEIFPEEFSLKARVFFKTFTPMAAQTADLIIVPSARVKNDIVQLYNMPPNKIWVVHEAADEIFKPLDRRQSREEIAQKYHIESDFMLFTGFARLRRNLASLLKALLELKRQFHLSQKLVIVGRYDSAGTNYPSLITELGIEKEVIHFGHIPEKDLPLFYNAADVFVYPSSYEGFGLPLVEAMACGTPIVTSNAPPMPEIVGNSGLFIDPSNPAQMAQTIYDVLSDEHLQAKLRKKSLERSRFFSWDKTAEKTLEAYRQTREQTMACKH